MTSFISKINKNYYTYLYKYTICDTQGKKETDTNALSAGHQGVYFEDFIALFVFSY